ARRLQHDGPMSGLEYNSRSGRQEFGVGLWHVRRLASSFGLVESQAARGQLRELRQKFCYPRGGGKRGKMIRCAKSDCYPGRNGQKHEPEDPQGSIGEDEAAVSHRWNGVQAEAAGSSAGALWISPQSGHPSAAGPEGGGWAADPNGPARGV